MSFYWKILLVLLFPFLSLGSDCKSTGDISKADCTPVMTYESLPVQEDGRIKPLITLARESLQLVHGKSRYQGQEALAVFTTWILVPKVWEDKEIIKMDHPGLKQMFGFDKDRKYFSPGEINKHSHLSVLFSDLAVRVQRKEKLNAYYQAASRLKAQLVTFYGFSRGGLHVFPPEKGSEENTWRNLGDLDPAISEKFFKAMSAYSTQFVDGLDKEKGALELKQALRDFTQEARKKGQGYPEAGDMDLEVHYQKLDPFFWTWVIYLLASVFYALSFLVMPNLMGPLGSLALITGFLFHTYGFIIRCLIAGRPPVSNMYESVVWVGWGIVFFAGLFFFLKKHRFIVLAGALVSTFCMMVADFAPVILDDRLQPLEPVLRSNLWLTIHVMTITLSYAAFFLALGVADYGLFLRVRGASSSRIGDLARTSYHLIQVGVVLLAAGTILGGVWADYSWGRFWGWDPKETWALIALMGYVALLHARLVGWVKDFGMLAGAVLAFSLVLMAWYGVNFVLGAGLHSYGFGAGGLEYVTGFVVLHFIFVAYAWLVRWNQ